jgi:D-beta-D-heptose 7-phosphate kinase/D-beta-D-heptose 1-phosphate adenosyltransferase
MSDLERVFAAISRARALVVGDVMLDEQIAGTADRISPEAPVPVVQVRKVEQRPGGAANVAANLAALGARVAVAGVTGVDAQAQTLQDVLRARSIEPLLVRDAARPTTTKTRIIAHQQQIARVDREDPKPVSGELQQALLEMVEGALAEARVVILSDYRKGVLTDGLTRRIICRCASAGLPVFVDPKGSDYEKYRGAFAITPNVKEAFEALRAQPEEPESIDEAGQMLSSWLVPTAVIVTRGEEGMSIYRPGQPPLHVSAAPRQVYDVTGAGDTAVAVLALCSAAGAELESAVRLANCAAGIAVGKLGAATVTLEELRAAARAL